MANGLASPIFGRCFDRYGQDRGAGPHGGGIRCRDAGPDDGDRGALIVVGGDGWQWPLRDVFALLIGWSGSDALKLTSNKPHNPRITAGRLVVARESWRTTVGDSGLTETGRLPEYLAARRLGRALGLPEKVFAAAPAARPGASGTEPA